MKKLALGIEYDGSLYCGWQKQKDVLSVQECVESALKKITSTSVDVYCAGRTDAGVHALGQVVHFEVYINKYLQSTWILGVNSYLPSDICVRWVSLVPYNFHARFSAISRRYFYVIYNDYVRSALFFGKVWHYKKVLNINKMLRAAQCLIGKNNFSAFRASGCQSCSVWRTIYHLRIIRRDKYVIIDIKANAFMYHMVRNIVGSLVEVGCGHRAETWILELLKYKNRSLSGVTAPARGLYLAEITYPEYFSIPSIFLDKIFWE